MGVPPRGVLDIYGSPHLTLGYLLNMESRILYLEYWEKCEVKSLTLGIWGCAGLMRVDLAKVGKAGCEIASKGKGFDTM